MMKEDEMAADRILAKQLSSDELGAIEDEWSDSTTVTQLLAHIKYLTDIIHGRQTKKEKV